MELVDAYQATDGSLFNTSDQCQEHETSLLWRAKIDDFIHSPFCDYQKSVHQSMSRKTIVGWERYKVSIGGNDGISK